MATKHLYIKRKRVGAFPPQNNPFFLFLGVFCIDNKVAGSLFIVVALLITVIISVLIYWSVADVGQLPTQSETFACTNTSNLTTTIAYVPADTNNFYGEWYNSTSAAWVRITNNLTRTGRTVSFVTHDYTPNLGDAYSGITQATFTYNTTAGVIMRDNINPQASTTFTLAPIIAIVIIASLILLAVSGFGRKENL